MDCLTATSPGFLLFWALAIALLIAVARHNGFGLKEALKAAIGLRPFQRNWVINLLNAACLVLPLGLMIWQVQGCPS